MRDEDVLHRLEALGATTPPPPSGAFVDDLAARLDGGGVVPAGRATGRSRSRVLAPIVSAVAASILTAVVLRDSGAPTQTVEMIKASGEVEVVLPDGSVVAGIPGMEVPDGSIIRVHGQGEAVVDDVVVGSDEVAEVNDGVVEPAGVPAPPTTTSPSTTAPTSGTTRRQATTTTVGPTPTTVAPPTTTTAPEPTTTTTAPAREVQPMRGAATFNPDGSVVLRWSSYQGDDFGAYVVIRATGDNRPDRPEGNEVVFRAFDQQRLFFVDHPEPGSRPSYRIVALDTDRKLVGATFILRPQRPQP